MDTSSASSGLELVFYRWLNSDYPPYMSPVIEVFDGTKWVTVWQIPGPPGVADSMWTQVKLDLTPHANSKLKLRFGFATQSGVYNVANWNVDDLRLVKKSCN